jgi:hypothetical protein
MWLNLLVDHHYFWLYHKIDHKFILKKKKKPHWSLPHPNEIWTRFRIQFVLTRAGYERTEDGTDGSFSLVEAGTCPTLVYICVCVYKTKCLADFHLERFGAHDCKQEREREEIGREN